MVLLMIRSKINKNIGLLRIDNVCFLKKEDTFYLCFHLIEQLVSLLGLIRAILKWLKTSITCAVSAVRLVIQLSRTHWLMSTSSITNKLKVHHKKLDFLKISSKSMWLFFCKSIHEKFPFRRSNLFSSENIRNFILHTNRRMISMKYNFFC